jgi:endonuclease G
MSNMMPQAPNNNQKTWANLENYTRTFLPGYEAYVICGSYGKGGTGSNGYAETIDQGRVTVPNRTWKVIVLLPVGDNDLARVGTSTRIIAVDMPNDNGLSLDWGTYRTSVDAIEAATGYDLLSNLPLGVQAAIESKVDTGPTN